MTNLTKAHDELYRRGPDETFPTMQALWDHCDRQKEQSTDRWQAQGDAFARKQVAATHILCFCAARHKWER